ncbi:hypothetical protein L1049_020806 [Liquidambar formosana]|uniref:Uncharacterized protein n=1 Tax=Liquidambar formosana TaxID=63359 RepID=A0AAP0X6D7_LIQFO
MLYSKCTLLDFIHRCNSFKSFKQIHAHLITSGIIRHELVVTKAVEFFGKYIDFVDYACEFLNQIDSKLSSFPYNTLIAGYASGNAPRAAVLVYRQIVRDGFSPDMYTFPVVMKACSKFSGIEEGEEVHGVVVKMGFRCDLYAQNSLLHFYSVCGECSGASRVFDDMLVRDVVSWTGLISGYARVGLFDEAVALFLKMDVEPNIATFVSVLVACGRLGYLSLGRGIHGLVYKRTFGMGLVVGNALMDMYVKCECLCEAKRIFDELPERDIVSWTSVISGLVQCKRPKESLELFCNMQVSGVEPDRIILTSVLSACASIGALDYGRWVHEYIDRRGMKWDIHIGTAMVDMYAKCGCIEMAMHTFYGMSSKNVFTWNALLGGLAMHGHGHEVLKHFDLMVRAGIRPNGVTFLAILTACCHSGLVDEGRRHFYKMISPHYYSLSPRLEHYGCMVDLFCRAGLLDEAQDLIKTMPMPPDVLIWGAILSACKAQGNVELSQEISGRLLELESQDSGFFVLLSNIYATNERWDDVKRVRRLMKEKGIRKIPGSSVIEVDGKAHEFLVGHTSHPRNKDILILLNVLSDQVYLEGHFLHPLMR